MDERCRCRTGSYCHKHKVYNLPKDKLEREARRTRLLAVSGHGRPTIKTTTEVG
jgi:hypothetical protein